VPANPWQAGATAFEGEYSEIDLRPTRRAQNGVLGYYLGRDVMAQKGTVRVQVEIKRYKMCVDCWSV
jgi:hypothetical protein